MKQPDRFERAVERVWLGDGHKRDLWEKQCTRLLRAEHRAVVRLVKQQVRWTQMSGIPGLTTEVDGCWISRAVLLAALAKRAT